MSDSQNWQDYVNSLTPRTQEMLDRVHPPVSLPAENQDTKWHVVLVPEIEDIRLLVFDSMLDVARYLRTKVNEPGLRVFVFIGRRAHISSGAQRYLLHPDGTRCPLFEMPSEVDIQEDGLIGPSSAQIFSQPLPSPVEPETPERQWDDGGEDAAWPDS